MAKSEKKSSTTAAPEEKKEATPLITVPGQGGWFAVNGRFHDGHPRRFTEGSATSPNPLFNRSFILDPLAGQRMREKGEKQLTTARVMEALRMDARICSPIPRGGAKISGVPTTILGRELGFTCEDCGEAWEWAKELPKEIQWAETCLILPDSPHGWKYVFPPALTLARTQKAQGIHALKQMKVSGMQVASFALAQDWDTLSALWGAMHGAMPGTVFVRACPVRPRHGFVDSKVVYTLEELRQLHDETLAADPLGEWLLGTKIAADTSAVVTPMSIALGPGHDGATAGVGCVTLPLARAVGLRMEDMPEEVRQHAAIAAPEQPYIELVMDPKESLPYLTQLRAGLETPRSGDYIPEDCIVSQVIVAEGSHLKWETDMAALRGKAKGIVVDHVGGSMISHFTLHAVANGVAVLTSRHPRVGEVLTATAGSQEAYSREAFLSGLFAYYGEKKRKMREILPGAVYTFHQSAWLRGEASYLLGWSIGCIHHAGVMAVSGESRHAMRRGHRNAEGKEATWALELQEAFPRGIQRSEVFQKIADDPSLISSYLPLMTRAMRGACWEGGYGGSLWNLCLNATLKLDDVLVPLVKGEGDSDALIAQVISITNQLLHLAHNNGWWFNKFISPDVMNLPYWKEGQGWMMPSMLKYVFPGLSAMRLRDEKGMAWAKGWWLEREVVPEAIKSLPCAWGHQLTGATWWVVKGKGFSWNKFINAPEPQEVYLRCGWNFGNGFHGKRLLTYAERQMLVKQGMKEGASQGESLPIWLQEGDITSIPFLSIKGINGAVVMKGLGVMRVGETAVALDTFPLTGLDNDVHESLIGEALKCLKG